MSEWSEYYYKNGGLILCGGCLDEAYEDGGEIDEEEEIIDESDLESAEVEPVEPAPAPPAQATGTCENPDCRQPIYGDGGQVRGFGVCKACVESEFADGGKVKGRNHANGGEGFTVQSTEQEVELEGGEGVLSKKTMGNEKKYDFEGKKATAREIASEINTDTGGNPM